MVPKTLGRICDIICTSQGWDECGMKMEAVGLAGWTGESKSYKRNIDTKYGVSFDLIVRLQSW